MRDHSPWSPASSLQRSTPEPGRSLDPASPRRQRAVRRARGLGWFSIGLGLAELFAPRWVARATGLQGRETLLRLCGVREIATGVGLLLARDPGPWVWARVGGDAMDLALLGSHAHDGHPQALRAVTSIAAVAGVTAVDVASAVELRRSQPPMLAHDYSDRSGLPRPPEQMRGSAAADFVAPADMRVPVALQPYVLH